MTEPRRIPGEAPKLLPCPWCGGDAIVGRGEGHPEGTWRVRCEYRNGCAMGPYAGPFKSEAAAIEAWNRRAAAPLLGPTGAKQIVEEAADALEIETSGFNEHVKSLRALAPLLRGEPKEGIPGDEAGEVMLPLHTAGKLASEAMNKTRRMALEEAAKVADAVVAALRAIPLIDQTEEDEVCANTAANIAKAIRALVPSETPAPRICMDCGYPEAWHGDPAYLGRAPVCDKFHGAPLFGRALKEQEGK